MAGEARLVGSRGVAAGFGWRRMSKLAGVCLGVAATVFVSLAAAQGPPPPPPPPPASGQAATSGPAGPVQQAATDVPGRMEQVIQSYVHPGQFMGSVLVARDGNILLSKGYGDADVEWEIPNAPTTKFRIGSMTKQFTATSILLLEERGKLKVEDPVKKYMPDAPAAWDKVTIQSLLTHTSGIPSFTSFPDYHATEAIPTTPEQLVARFRDKPLEFQPGEKWEYSNSGYVLLGYLIEKISGQSYKDFLEENIFKPVGMRDSGYDSNQAIVPRRASGYSPGAKGPANAGYIDMTIPFSAGALYSTTEDLLRWETALFGGNVLSAASLTKMTTAFKSDYGFGLMIHTVNGRKEVEHGGGFEGFNTEMQYFPEEKLAIIVLGNLNGSAPDEIATKLGAVVHGEKVVLASERKEIPLPANMLEGYVGIYELAPTFRIAITLEDGGLKLQATNQPKFPLFAQSTTSFFMKVVDAEVNFEKNDQGAVSGLVLHQGGRDMKGRRLTAEEVAAVRATPERKEVQLAPEILAHYPGTYELAPTFSIVITVEGGQLMEQATGQPKFPLFAESETRFFLKAVDAEVEFVSDDKGAVTALILHQNGRDMKGVRKN